MTKEELKGFLYDQLDLYCLGVVVDELGISAERLDQPVHAKKGLTWAI